MASFLLLLCSAMSEGGRYIAETEFTVLPIIQESMVLTKHPGDRDEGRRTKLVHEQ